jgi:hypothetical protein
MNISPVTIFQKISKSFGADIPMSGKASEASGIPFRFGARF